MADTTMHNAFDLVIVSQEQASAILNKMAELFTDAAPEVRDAFLHAAQDVLIVEPPVLQEG